MANRRTSAGARGALLLLLVASMSEVRSEEKAATGLGGLPSFSWRCRLNTANPASTTYTTTFAFGGSTVASNGTEWSQSATYIPPAHDAGPASPPPLSRARTSPMASAKIQMMVVSSKALPRGPLGNGSVVGATVEVTLHGADHGVLTLPAQLFGPHLALVLSNNRAVVEAPVQTMVRHPCPPPQSRFDICVAAVAACRVLVACACSAPRPAWFKYAT